MIKAIFTTLAMFAMANAAYAMTPSDTDLLLLKAGLVDKSFKYTDVNLMKKGFQGMTEDLRAELPKPYQNGFDIIHLTIMPYYREYHIRSRTETGQYGNGETLSGSSLHNDDLKPICLAFFRHKYVFANHIATKIKYYNAYNHPLYAVLVKPKDCLSIME